MPAEQLQFLGVAVIAALALLLGFWQLRVTGKLRRELEGLRRELTSRSAPSAIPRADFSASLNQAERQQPAAGAGQRSSTEKYRYVASLADQGMDAGGIAAALQLSTAEVKQLLQLARLKQRP